MAALDPIATIPPTVAQAGRRAPASAGNGGVTATNANRSPAAPSDAPDPVPELRFVVTLPGIEIGRFKEVGGLSVQFDVKEYAEGGVNHFMHKLPGRMKWGPITLKRGVTHEDALLAWLWEVRTKPRLVDMQIALLGPGAKKVRSWGFVGAFPIKWTGPNLNAGSNQIATEALEIAHSGMTEAS
jgi:phage tail-like protein